MYSVPFSIVMSASSHTPLQKKFHHFMKYIPLTKERSESGMYHSVTQSWMNSNFNAEITVVIKTEEKLQWERKIWWLECRNGKLWRRKSFCVQDQFHNTVFIHLTSQISEWNYFKGFLFQLTGKNDRLLCGTFIQTTFGWSPHPWHIHASQSFLLACHAFYTLLSSNVLYLLSHQLCSVFPTSSLNTHHYICCCILCYSVPGIQSKMFEQQAITELSS